MVLFVKKECMFCGGKKGLMGTKLLDGDLCYDCTIDIMPKFLEEREFSTRDTFRYKDCCFKTIQECSEYFKNGNEVKKLSKELIHYLGVFALDKEKGVVEIKGHKAVYKIPVHDIDTIIFNCYDDQNANKMKFIFCLFSENCSWLNGYVFEGVFKNDALFKYGSIKKAKADIERIALEMEVNMISLDVYQKMIKKEQRKERLNMLKSVFSRS
ncbi:hypothetical protein IEO70_06765 [Bacillus sp. AGMB 02131]|uniref:DUF4428 domain-containing protein n=1 Tax=Peribacillus faecalis TaxID=2772559 RepID=A0A927CVS8_9BACI|nr:hypothetical protein [Peribacillus faecalis]MBD3108064.1 hypothetical protein [Peribacillus faecalis]